MELEDAIRLNRGAISWRYDSHIIVQEYIAGEEYSMDSTCCEGHHRTTFASHYIKKIIEGRGPIFDYAELIGESHPRYAEIAEYNDKVLSAIGIRYGAVHAEYKIDDEGVVLIEINCRVTGPMQKYTFMDKVWGEHVTFSALESYVDPEKCIEGMGRPLHPISWGAVKMIIVPEEMDVAKSHVESAFENLDSYEYAIAFGDDRTYPKTIDLHTIGGLVFLENKSRDS